MSKCKKCGKSIEYLKYYCDKCKKEIVGIKPKKSRNLCSGCNNNYYNNKYIDKNPFGGKGCMSYKTSEVIIKNTYFSKNQVVPNPRWKLSCYI